MQVKPSISDFSPEIIDKIYEGEFDSTITELQSKYSGRMLNKKNY